jgi:septation ring formation regulator EzrA
MANEGKDKSRIDVHVHIHDDASDDNNNKVLKAIAELRREFMASVQQFQDALAAVDAETTRIGELIAQLVSQLNRTDLTEAQEAEILASLTAASNRLKTVGADVTNPVPDPTPEIPV